MANDASEAEEIVQDLFYALWEKRQTVRIDVSLKSYLYTAVHNRCLKYIRRRNVEKKYRSSKLGMAGQQETSESQSHPDELCEIFEKTMDALPPRCSAIFRMNRFEGLKYAEIAERLSLSVKTIESNMGKALKMLRRNLRDYTETA